MYIFRFFAQHYCWPCSMNKCHLVTKKDNICVCCRRNHQ